MLHDLLGRYPGSLSLALVLVSGFALALGFSAIYDRADPRHRAKLKLVITTVFTPVIFLPLIMLEPGHWRTWVATVAVLVVVKWGHDYFSRYPGRLWLLWCLGIGGVALAVLFGDATMQAAQYGGSIVSGIMLCAISVLFSGFCFGYLVARWRADRAVRREAQQTP